MRLAIDVGGVLFQMQDLDAARQIDKLMPGAQEAMASLSTEHELWILSFCGSTTELRVRASLHTYGFTTWIPEKRWIFVRSPKHKGPAMVTHGLNHLVDDLPTNVDRVKAIGLHATLFAGDWSVVFDDLRNAPSNTD
jgi:hypothetical protein